MAPSFAPETKAQSPTLSNSALILPEGADIGPRHSEGHAPALVSPLDQLQHAALHNGRLGPSKSMGNVPQRAALPSGIVIPSSFDIESDAGLSAVTEDSHEGWEAPWQRPQAQRPLSMVSESTTGSLDLDAIPDYKGDDGESDIFTVDYLESGKRSPSKLDPAEGHRQSHYRNSGIFSTDLSKRADAILANAKKRLNVMDQNLRGARALTTENLQRATSLHVHESPYANRYLKDANGARPVHMRNRSDITLMQSPARARQAMIGEPLLEEANESDIKVATVLRVSRSQELPRSPRVILSSGPGSRGGQSTADSPLGKEPRTAPVLTDDLRSKVEELNQRIALLRNRTKADHMRRLSTQSLRQSSPFTDAEADPHTPIQSVALHTVDSSPAAAVASVAGSIIAGSTVSDNSRPHEDRADAFDYRTCFLHSSLGNNARLSGSSGSTARGADYETPERLKRAEKVIHSRLASYDSAASYATVKAARPMSPATWFSGPVRVDSGSGHVSTTDEDRLLIEGLLTSAQAAGESLQHADEAAEWRRRIHAAKNILDGRTPL